MPDLVKRYIARCSYEGIEFPVLEEKTAWGHDKVEHSAYGVPGVENETTGRQPLKISVEAAFFNTFRGWPKNLYPGTWKQFIAKLESTPIGVFTHSTRGFVDVHVDSVVEIVTGKGPRNGTRVTLSLTEDNATASIQHHVSDGQPQSDPSTATDAAYANALTVATASGFQVPASVGDAFMAISDTLATLRAATLPYTTAVRLFASIIAATVDLRDTPVLAVISAHDVRVAMEALIVALNRYQDRYLGASTPETYVVPVTMSLARIASLLGSTTARVRNANQIPDELFVPARTKLLVI